MSIKTILSLVALVASFAGGYWLSDNQWSLAMEKEKAEQAEAVAKLSEQYRSKESELAKHAQELDKKYTHELSVAEARVDELESSLADNRQRLRVKATCSSPMPSSGATSSVGNAGTPELDASARADYLRLQRGLELQDKQIKYLQGYIQEQCLKG